MTRVLRDLFLPVLVPSSTAIALLYYYGLVRTATFYGRFAVPVEVLGLTTADLVGQSLDVFVHPLRLGFVTAALVTLLYKACVLYIGPRVPPSYGKWVDPAMLTTGLAAVVATDRTYLLGSAVGLDPLLASIIWTAAIPVIWFALTGLAMRNHPIAAVVRPLARGWLSLAVFGTLFALGLFVTTAFYARPVGDQSADRAILFAGDHPSVTVVTRINLAIDDVAATEAFPNGDSTLYRYSDLKLLEASREVYLLYAAQRPDDGVIILRNSDVFSIRIREE
ncbi:MAG: hypothetical protein R2761_14295 [Acidimicrobiales bacterium]